MSEFHKIVSTIPQRFRAEKAEAIEMRLHFEITAGDGHSFTVAIFDSTCTVIKGLEGTPNCVIKTKTNTYVKLELGQANPQMAYMMGKVKVSNIEAMLSFAKLFRKYDPKKNYTETTTLPSAKQRPVQQGPLKGITIIDFTRLLPGPLATMMMADMGAEVIKIEDPDSPDQIRSFPPLVDGTSAYYTATNRNKKSLAINYRSEAGKQVILELVKTADVVIEQFRPGVMAQMGLGYEQLKAIKPDMIYVSVTGYGQTGPYAQRAGHDLNYIATAGLLGLTGTPDRPTIPGAQIADIAGGSYMAMNACMAALLSRNSTGKGQHVDVAMLDATMPLKTLAFAEQQALGKASGRGNHQLSGQLANYNIYQASDGRFMALGALEPKFWNIFCDAVGHAEWKERILDTSGELHQQVAELFNSKDSSHWQQLGEVHDCCLSLINNLEELADQPQIKHRQMVTHAPDDVQQLLGMPLQFLGTPGKILWAAPKLGADTIAVLQHAGIEKEQLTDMLAKGIIAASE